MNYKYSRVSSDPSNDRTDCIIKIDDDGVESFVPNDANNSDWQAYQDWLAVPNTPQAADAV